MQERFKQVSSLKKHEIIHSEDAPYECKTYKTKFKLRSVLNRHEKIHF